MVKIYMKSQGKTLKRGKLHKNQMHGTISKKGRGKFLIVYKEEKERKHEQFGTDHNRSVSGVYISDPKLRSISFSICIPV